MSVLRHDKVSVLIKNKNKSQYVSQLHSPATESPRWAVGAWFWRFKFSIWWLHWIWTVMEACGRQFIHALNQSKVSGQAWFPQSPSKMLPEAWGPLSRPCLLKPTSPLGASTFSTETFLIQTVTAGWESTLFLPLTSSVLLLSWPLVWTPTNVS